MTISAKFFIRIFGTYLSTTAENETGQEPICGGVGDWSRTFNCSTSRCLGGCLRSCTEDWDLQSKTEGLSIFCPKQCLLVSREHREEYGIYATGLGRSKDTR